MPLFTCDVAGNFVWSPHDQKPTYFVIGTASQQLDASFDSSSQLSVYLLNLTNPSQELSRSSLLNSSIRYAKLLWDGPSLGDEGMAGIIVAGSDKGDLYLYDPSLLIESGKTTIEEIPDVIVDHKTNHVGSVQALDFNKFQPNLLASGGGESDIFIWDLNKMETPMTPGTKSQPADDVLDLSWNHKVQHILASTFRNRCVVWDLRKSDPIIRLTDAMMKMRSRSVRWHPSVSTRLCVSSDDDLTPWLQLWDLRFATAPMITLSHGHTGGITSIDWCPHDQDTLLSCGRDGQVFAWSMTGEQNSAEWLYGHCLSEECPQGGLHSVHWCPTQPGLYATTSFEFGVQMYSVLGASVLNTSVAKQREQRRQRKQSALEDSFGMDTIEQNLPPVVTQTKTLESDPVIKKAPTWMKRAGGASFGFGGRLITFNHVEPSQVKLHQVITDAEIVQRSDQLIKQVNTPNPKELAEFCSNKLKEKNENAIDKSLWNFIEAHTDSVDTRGAFLRLLGLNAIDVSSFIQTQFTTHGCKLEDLVSTPSCPPPPPPPTQESSQSTTTLPPQDNENIDNFFENISSSDVNGVANEVVEQASEQQQQSLLTISREPLHLHSPPGDDTEKALCLALMTGQLTHAMDLLLLQDREGEALILAIASADPGVYETVKKKVLQKSQKRAVQQDRLSSHLLSASIEHQWRPLIDLCDLHSWREMLACIITYTDTEEFRQLCEILADRLENSDDSEMSLNACLCYIACGNVEKMAKCFLKQHPIKESSDLLTVMELVLSLQTCVGRSSVLGDTVNTLYYQYASVLVNEGQLLPALMYLSQSRAAASLGADQLNRSQTQKTLALLLDRVYHGVNMPIPREIMSNPPPKPFEIKRFSTQAHSRLQSASTGANLNSWNRPAGGPSADNVFHLPKAPLPNVPATNWGAPGGNTSRVNPMPASIPGTYHQPSVPSAPGSFQPGPPVPGTFQPGPPVPGTFQPSPSSIGAYQSSFSAQSPAPFQPMVPNAFQPTVPPMRPSSSLSQVPPPVPPGVVKPPPPVFTPSQKPLGSSSNSYNAPPNPDMFLPKSVAPISMNAPPTSSESTTLLPAALRKDMKGWNDPPILPERYGDIPIEAPPPASNTFYNPAAFVTSVAPPVAPAFNLKPMRSSPAHVGYVEPVVHLPPPSSSSITPTYPLANSTAPPLAPPPSSLYEPAPPLPQATAPAAPVVVTKPELPAQYENLKVTLSELCERCKTQANNRQIKLKMEDIGRRLENLYDLLREDKLSASVVEGLQNICYAANQGDYSNALGFINGIIQSANFAEIRTFMPAVKVLMQTALQMYT